MKVISKILNPSGFFPNNEKLPVLHYVEAFNPNGPLAPLIQETFKSNGWVRSWINGIYDYHHYHSNNHEVLGISSGSCDVLIGVEHEYKLSKGDVLILPAGTAHKRIKATQDFRCIGAYSINVPYNMHYGEEKELAEAIKKIKSLPLPKTDPVFGAKGPLLEYWNH